jgi:hypothetical protein
MSPRHGEARRQQMALRTERVRGFKQQGVAKKMSSISIGQLRTMFPDLMALPDEALRREAAKRLLERR